MTGGASGIGEAIARGIGGDRIVAYSAGLTPTGTVAPETVKVLRRLGYRADVAGNGVEALDALERHHLSGTAAKLLDDILCGENRLSCHRLNTVAGSILVTFTIAEMAEIAHINKVTENSPTASCGVMTIGKGVD